MRLSSVSLIGAALAAIAGSVIAAPLPLHARALEDINSLSERDVDVYNCGSRLALLERKDYNKAQEAADAAQEAVDAAQEAAFKAMLIADNADEDHRRTKYLTKAGHHRKDAAHYRGHVSNHSNQAKGNQNVPSNKVLDGAIAQYKHVTGQTSGAITKYDCHPVVAKFNAAFTMLDLARGGR